MNPICHALCSVPLVLVSLGLLALQPRAAAADSDERAGTVIVYGKAESKRRSAVRSAVEEALREAGWSLGRSFSRREADTVARCFAADKPGLCIAATAAAKGIERVVAVQVDPERGKGSRATLRLSGQLADAGTPDVILQLRFCSPCSRDELATVAQELVKLLLENSQVRAATTKIALRTQPAGVVVTIDGKLIGGESTEIATVAGSHTLLFELDGYTRQTRTVEAVEGETVTVEIELSPSAGIVIAPRPEEGDGLPREDSTRRGDSSSALADSGGAGGGIVVRDGPDRGDRGDRDRGDGGGSRLLPYLLVGLGSTAVAGGVFAIVIDEDPVADPGVEQPATILDTGRLGAGLVIGGALTGALGGYLWWRAERRSSSARKRGRAASILTVHPARQGALVGLTGNF